MNLFMSSEARAGWTEIAEKAESVDNDVDDPANDEEVNVDDKHL